MDRRDFIKLASVSALGAALPSLLADHCRWEFNDEYCTSWRTGHWSLMGHRLYGDDNVRVRFYPKGELDFRSAVLPGDFKCIHLVKVGSGVSMPLPDEYVQRIAKLEPLFMAAANGCTWIPFDDA